MPVLMLLLAIWPCAGSANDELYSLIHERLSLMKDVAAYKWIHAQPITASEREQEVIREGVRAGLKTGITADSSARLFTAQIEAAKGIQQCWFNRWQAGTDPVEAVDLVTKVRPALIDLGRRIMAKLSDATPDRDLFNEQMSVDCLAGADRDAIYEALQGIAIYSDRLAQVKGSKILRIGTTGDYAPFSYSGDDQTFTGIDIDLGRNLAVSLGAEMVIVKTSWPSLMDDLAAGAYDIAMSGVSITEVRSRVADFSQPYHVGGKTPITQCRFRERFGSLAEIDQPGVRLIVNPGGTNEQYIDAHIHKATKLLHTDNRTIFDEIIADRADLMITDSIEVRLKTARYPALCASMPGATLTRQEKGYMMPRDAALLKSVNAWLEGVKAGGLLTDVFEQHLP